MEKPLSFQEVIMRLERFWAEHGCTIWQPYSEKVGAGTMNPATVLRVLGPEPWNVAYVEPSYRPADGRYGENPNRMQMHIQYQVILKPDPGNPQELYLESLQALGIDPRQHDIRFVEDNWESPALGAWGLGWEVWLDGLEITQFTYFQQAGGIDLDPVAVELTYGLERIVMFLQEVRSVWEIGWDGIHTYGDILLQPEIEHCTYDFEMADVSRLQQMYSLYEAEAKDALAHSLVIPAHDYLLRCSHTFNLLDARGAIGVTERARYMARMRELARAVAEAYLKQREGMGYPLLKVQGSRLKAQGTEGGGEKPSLPLAPCPLLLEIGTEELPASDLSSALEQLRLLVPQALEEARLDCEGYRVVGTPRRLAVYVAGLAPQQRDREQVVKGPPKAKAFDPAGRPTQAAIGFAKSRGLAVEDLKVQEFEGKEYVVATAVERGRPAPDVLRELLPGLISSLRFDLSMRWNESQVVFSRPIRWLVALLGDEVIDFGYAGVATGRISCGLRPLGSPELTIPRADDYFEVMEANQIVVDPEERRRSVKDQIERLAAEVGGKVPDDPDLLEEVTNLVEQPMALRGFFDPEFLKLPKEVLITVMREQQRYFPVVKDERRETKDTSRLSPYFIAVCNGDSQSLDLVRQGNGEVLRARFADADFFYKADTKRSLEEFLPRLDTLTFQERLGSVLDKVRRLEKLAPRLGQILGLPPSELEVAQRAACLCKADLATQMVVEFTSLQGTMGREYALRSGDNPAVAEAIFEHYLPRFAGDALPQSWPGILVGLADRLDSLVGLFAVGLIPTGSADPYGLRRGALTLIQILIEKGISLSLSEAVSEAAELLPVTVDEARLAEVLSFIAQRLRGWLLEAGFRYDLVDAVLTERGDDPYLAYRTVADFAPWVERDDWMEILWAYSRSLRIVREFETTFPLDPAKLIEPSTQRLYEAHLACRAQVRPDSTIDQLFTAFRPMVEPINTFFDDVLVMTEDRELRENRLALLQRIAALTKGIVDLTRVEGF